MSLHILSIAYPFAPTGPCAVGGAEQVLTVVEEHLVTRGLHSTVVACSGSAAAGRLISSDVPPGLITPERREQVTEAHQRGIDRAVAAGVDLIHMHGIDFHRYRVPAQVPVLVTLHMPPAWYPEQIWHLPPNYQLQCVSELQRLACPAYLRDRLPVVTNGVALPSIAPQRKRRFALLLSRICPEKNLDAGLDAARQAGLPVLLAGSTFPYEEHLRYLREEIEPRLGRQARLLGPVTGARKQRLLAAARCLLIPSLAPETSSLIAMEALAAGTPVIAYRSGALPEIVEDGRTGFLVDNVDAMAAAITRFDAVEASACRAAAAARFPAARMVDEYLALYARMLNLPRAA